MDQLFEKHAFEISVSMCFMIMTVNSRKWYLNMDYFWPGNNQLHTH